MMRTAHDRFQKCKIATIGDDVDSKINMIELKRSPIPPGELQLHQREDNPKSGTPARFIICMAILL
jgi:hypothetical protein